jgi:tetratricopeptide (TPR) repeat protein
MNLKPLIQLRLRAALIALMGLCVSVSGCSQSNNAQATLKTESGCVQLADAPLPPDSLRLARLAFDAASKLPLVPHAKNRARMQASVVRTCAAVGLLHTGESFIDRMDGWQQALALTQLARAAARGERPESALSSLHRAESAVSNASQEYFAQEWQRDRIRAGIAATLIHLGRSPDAAEFEKDLEPSESGIPLLARSEVCRADEVDAQIARIDQALASKHFEQLRSACEACVALLKQVSRDASQVNALETKVLEVNATFPAQSRFAVLAQLAESALQRGQTGIAKKRLADAMASIPPGSMLPEERIPLLGRVAELQFRMGETIAADEQLQAALELYKASRDRVVDIARASALRALAEAAHAMKQHDQAFQLWMNALDEGVANPNSRPRADDLVATCCSILRTGAVPPPSMLERAERIAAALGEPW